MSERTIQNGYLIAAQSDIENLRARIAALEEVVRAADGMRSLVQDTWIIYSDQRGLLLLRALDYDSKRAALGEIGVTP